VVGVAFLPFTLALLAGRLTRTLVLAWLVRHGGAEAVERWVRRPVGPTPSDPPPS
jgi:hypothetical protein